MVIWDAHHDARYVSAVDSLGDSVGEGAAIACVPLVDQRWRSNGARPHVLGILQLVVGHGPDKGRKKRLGLEMRSLLAVVRRTTCVQREGSARGLLRWRVEVEGCADWFPLSRPCRGL